MTPLAPNPTSVLMTWTFSPITDLLVVVGTIGYLWLAGRGGHWPRTRSLYWLAAMLVAVLAMNSPIAVYADMLFWVHMAQHLLLIMVVPVLLIWARPLELLGAPKLPGWSGWPVAFLVLYTAIVTLAHLTGYQQLSATHGVFRNLELAAFFVSGWLYFLPLVGSEREPWDLPYLLRFVLLAAGMGADTLTGIVLMLTSHTLVPAYAASHPGWGPTPLGDQELAGAIMWFGGDLLMMILMIITAVQWGRAGSDRQGLGNWLESARRSALLGADDRTLGQGVELDSDQRALDAYNATLAALHRQQPPRQ
ncbi:cytochrome c oxidase assembly protein [Pseudonocardia spinosispora]|uniref:cytochrome c oxidase assembly protein n=1 Tax=Pseudonocardia spinosispora TaxID=103441 RepID=UPI000686D12E|nr:cytochrome c oxidase assembly protein [Pseudonocardia spinosispora]